MYREALKQARADLAQLKRREADSRKTLEAKVWRCPRVPPCYLPWMWAQLCLLPLLPSKLVSAT